MDYFENNYVQLWIEDDILHGMYKKNTIITLQAAKEIVEAKWEFQKRRDYNVVAYVTHMNTLTPEARRYFAREGYKGTIRMGIVTLSEVKVVLCNMFITIDKPVRRTQLFRTKEEAVRWLKVEQNTGVTRRALL